MTRPGDTDGCPDDLATFSAELERMSITAELAATGSWLVEIVDPTLDETHGETRTFYGPYTDPVAAMSLAEQIDRELAQERRLAHVGDPMTAPLVTKIVPLLPPPVT